MSNLFVIAMPFMLRDVRINIPAVVGLIVTSAVHKILSIKVPLAFDILVGSVIRGSKLCDVIMSNNSVHNSSLFILRIFRL